MKRQQYYLPSQSWLDFLKGSTSVFRKEMAYPNGYSGQTSMNYLSKGSPSYRFELRKDDPNVNGSKRSEVALNPEPALDQRTYNYSILLPNGGAEDYALDPNGSEIITQWHNTPDPGESWTSPPVAIHTGAYHNNLDHYTLELNWDASPMSSQKSLQSAHFDLGSFASDKGKWVDWRVHIKWGWLVSQHPLIQIDKNGRRIFELKHHPNTTNDKQGVYMKFGIYKWDWAQTGAMNASILSTRVLYFGNLSIV